MKMHFFFFPVEVTIQNTAFKISLNIVLLNQKVC